MMQPSPEEQEKKILDGILKSDLSHKSSLLNRSLQWWLWAEPVSESIVGTLNMLTGAPVLAQVQSPTLELRIQSIRSENFL